MDILLKYPGGKRKLPLPLLLLCALLLLSACSAGDEKPELPPEPEEGVLIYAALNPVTPELKTSVNRFNESHPDAKLEIRDYSDEGGPERLLVELVAGRVPDIMELHQTGTGMYATSNPTPEAMWFRDPFSEEPVSRAFWMPYRQLVQKGYLEDLWPYIEKDPELGREGVLEAPLKAAEVNGGLYMLFKQVSVNTLIGPKKLIGERQGWTMAELMEAFSSMPADSTILRYGTVQRDVFFKWFSSTLNQYIDWEAGRCSFDNEEFRSSLLFISSFPSEFSSPYTEEQLEEEIVWRQLDGLQLLEPVRLAHLRELPFYDTYFEGGSAFVGYPTADGSVGSSFIIHGSKLAMSSACEDKDAAWDFMRELILKSYNQPRMKEAHELQWVRIPINRKDYELGNRVDLADKAEDIPPRFTLDDGPEFRVLPANEDDLQLYEALLNSTTQIYWPDNKLSDVVWESIGPYLAGDKSLEDTIALVQDRVTLYINEQK